MTSQEKRAALIANLQEGVTKPLGMIVWWNIRSVLVTKEELSRFLTECSLPERYARDHNYRSAFIRALKGLEEDRIIRKVSEDEDLIIYQFTAEQLISGGVGKLDYHYETRVIVNRKTYAETQDFAQALVNRMRDFVANPQINAKVLELYQLEKTRYRSGDITRYIQRMLEDLADFVSLREQGNVYFVPAQYMETIQKLTRFVSLLGPTNRFEWLPILNAAESRVMLQRSVIEELESVIDALSNDVATLPADSAAVAAWSRARIAKVERIKRRILAYGAIVPDAQAKQMRDGVQAIEAKILGTRVIDVD
jgi:hypothetical protein